MTTEKLTTAGNGWVHLFLAIGMMLFSGILFLGGAVTNPFLIIVSVPLFIVAMIWFGGLFTIQPNEACLLTFFGP
jgi:hypothetical protein